MDIRIAGVDALAGAVELAHRPRRRRADGLQRGGGDALEGVANSDLPFAAALGVALGYYLRILVALSRKGSIELSLKQMELSAKDREKSILYDAEKKAEEIVREARREIKEKEEKLERQKSKALKITKRPNKIKK